MDVLSAKEMVYWEDIPGDAQHRSPFFSPGQERFLSFEYDHGAFNNIRMGMVSLSCEEEGSSRNPHKGAYGFHRKENKSKQAAKSDHLTSAFLFGSIHRKL